MRRIQVMKARPVCWTKVAGTMTTVLRIKTQRHQITQKLVRPTLSFGPFRIPSLSGWKWGDAVWRNEGTRAEKIFFRFFWQCVFRERRRLADQLNLVTLERFSRRRRDKKFWKRRTQPTTERRRRKILAPKVEWEMEQQNGWCVEERERHGIGDSRRGRERDRETVRVWEIV